MEGNLFEDLSGIKFLYEQQLKFQNNYIEENNSGCIRRGGFTEMEGM